MGLQPPILEDVSSQSIRRLLVWKLVNPNVHYAVGTSAGEFAAMTDSQIELPVDCGGAVVWKCHPTSAHVLPICRIHPNKPLRP